MDSSTLLLTHTLALHSILIQQNNLLPNLSNLPGENYIKLYHCICHYLVCFQTDSWGLAASVPNLPAPGKRPMSSQSPSIIINSMGEVAMVLGGEGRGTMITAIVQVGCYAQILSENCSINLVPKRYFLNKVCLSIRQLPNQFCSLQNKILG